MIYIAIPFAAIGGVLSLYFRGMPFSISAGVGFIVLFGVAVLNGLVLISGFNELRAEGKWSLNDIIKKGSIRRIRPIFLTASTDILGFLPMAISTSAGAEVQRPLATVVIGGMLTSTLLTLVVLPVLYRIAGSGKKRRKLPLNTSLVAVLLLVSGLSLPGQVTAQETSFTLQQAIERAKENYPSLKAAQLETQKQRALKATAFDLGATSVYTGREEVGNGAAGIENQIGIGQNDIDVFGIPAKSKLAGERTQLAMAGEEITALSLQRDVSIAWYRALSAKKQWQLYGQLDSLFVNFLKAAELRYRTQETGRIEFLAASARYNQLMVSVKEAESAYRSSLQMLNQYLLFPSRFDIEVEEDVPESAGAFVVSDSLLTSPLLNYYAQQVNVSRAEWKVQKADFLPKLDLGYSRQSVDGLSGFYSWEAGISVPLLFFSQNGTTRAAKLDYRIAGHDFNRKKLELNAAWQEQVNRIKVLEEVLVYYNEKALPLAEEQIEAANLAYRLGSIDYVQFIQNVEAAIKTKQSFLDQEAEYLEVLTRLRYLKGDME